MWNWLTKRLNERAYHQVGGLELAPDRSEQMRTELLLQDIIRQVETLVVDQKVLVNILEEIYKHHGRVD